MVTHQTVSAVGAQRPRGWPPSWPPNPTTTRVHRGRPWTAIHVLSCANGLGG